MNRIPHLSVDRPEDDAKWRKMAASYDLMGDHIRIQEAFNDEIYKTFGNEWGNLTIPRYVIFDKSGKSYLHGCFSRKHGDTEITIGASVETTMKVNCVPTIFSYGIWLLYASLMNSLIIRYFIILGLFCANLQ